MPSAISIPVAELKAALAGLACVVNRRAPLAILKAVLVTRNAAGVVTIQATDWDAWATYRVAGRQAGGQLQIVVPFAELLAFVKTLRRNSEINLQPAGKKITCTGQARSSRRAKLNLKTFSVREWPAAPKVTGPVVALPEPFKLGFSEAAQCASRDESRYVINGVCLETGGQVVATDACCLYVNRASQFRLSRPAIILPHPFLVWPGFAQAGPWRLSARNTRRGYCLQIAAGRWSFVSRTIDAKFPAWEHLIPELGAEWTTAKLPAAAVAEILKLIDGRRAKAMQATSVRLEVTPSGQFQVTDCTATVPCTAKSNAG